MDTTPCVRAHQISVIIVPHTRGADTITEYFYSKIGVPDSPLGPYFLYKVPKEHVLQHFLILEMLLGGTYCYMEPTVM
jgi:hypothetical protein